MIREYDVVVPVAGECVFLNAVGSDETEANANANVALIDLSDDDQKVLEFKPAKLIVE